MNGIILVNKPKGMSSNTAVNIVKRAIGAKKCGHLGTLDLEGEGLLPVTVNAATKLFDYFLNKDKTYITTFQFGVNTDTLDAAGSVIGQKPFNFSRRELLDAINSMLGKQKQMPPMYSAKKVGGKVGYIEARKGNTLDLQPKEIEIYDIKLLKEDAKSGLYQFEITCSSGTYIRSIARDLGEKLNTYCIMQCILRTRCGVFCLQDAYSIEQIKNGEYYIIPPQDVFDFEELYLSETEFLKLCNGQKITMLYADGEYKVFYDDCFLGIGEVVNKELKLKLRLF